MNIIRTIRKHLSRYRDDESGSIAVETMMMVPFMAWAMLATLTFFDAYRNEAISHKAGLTIADMISREADTIGDDYIDGAHELLRFLTLDDPDPDLRVTVFYWNQATNKFIPVWSKVRGPRSEIDVSDMTEMGSSLPVLANLERAILIETWSTYDPPWNVGISSFTMQTRNIISPRFTTQLCFSNTPENTSTLVC